MNSPEDYTKKSNLSEKAPPDLLADIRRVVSFLQAEDFSDETRNQKLKKFVHEVSSAIRASAETSSVYQIHVQRVALYEGMSAEAHNEFELIRKQSEVISVLGKEVLIDFEYVDLDQLLSMRWRETNSSWTDATGGQNDWIAVHYLHSGATGFIHDRTLLVIYAKASDLLDAYRRFGYQIFESNVRREITKSKVNDAIRGQVATQRGMEEFKLLNNGITITCVNKEAPRTGG